ncbi:required for respiratory growth protein 9, mitochondrial [Aspergillus udagawae]|uniref:Required for respiratory growth protein 9, mitochondrial n=1 Tax=Aspergillus udagawae TaxID=91492 RepID=A0A8E0QJY3_9EURO|nr:required for respiratory growth protein 9 mitochondrial [Aspergillus udagawae]GFF49196.1 required for respiratory growth protein 9, mitochondrial [Aspergillus udagawae]GIC85357.1 required for respiratory growth protein 9 mitochondrial [Aspergillus udagawae]
MANSICVASSRLSLPTLLRNVFRSEFAADLGPRSEYKSLFALQRPPLAYRRIRGARQFSSLTLADHIPTSSKQPYTPASAANGSSVPQRDEPAKSGAGEITASGDPCEVVGSSPRADFAKNKKGSASEETVGPKPAANEPSDKKRSQALRTSSLSVLSKSKKKNEPWQNQKEALKKKFKEGWNPPKKLSPDALEGIRHLHAVAPDRFTTPVLAEQFQVSPEAIRRILKSKWRPSPEQMEKRRERWERRHDRIWSQMAELGLRPPKRRADKFSDANVLYDKPL